MSETENKVEKEKEHEGGSDVEEDNDKDNVYDPYYEPIISLPIMIPCTTNEEEEVELCNLRARLYRYDMVDHEWKERGTGNIKLLHHTIKNTVRIVMRRDKTLKICANHFITKNMEMVQHMNSERAFNWTAFGDFADETLKREFLAVRFGNIENAKIWKDKFDESQEIVNTKCNISEVADQSNDTLSDASSSSSSEDSSDDEASNLDSSKEKILESIEVAKEISNDKKISDDVITKLTELSVENKENKPANIA